MSPTKVNENLTEGTTSREPDTTKPSFEYSDRFSLATRGRSYLRQFFSMYQQRLNVLKPRVDKRAMEKWGTTRVA